MKIKVINKDNKEYLKLLNDFLLKYNLSLISENIFTVNPFINVIIYIENSNIIAYENYSIMYENAELNQIFVLENYRNNGIASKLLEYFLLQCKKCKNISLEVRNDNISAINLYKKFGFETVAIRKNYYGDVDGLLMVYKRGE